MYHPDVITRNISAAVASGKYPIPTYHSPQKVESAVRHLNTLRNMHDDGETWDMLREFNDEEIKFIRNERFLCRMDFHYFSTRYCQIKNPFDQIVQFKPWIGQQILLDVIGEMEKDELAIMIILLKARQLGQSRLASLIGLHRCITRPHVNAVLASSTPEKTELLADMLEFVFARLPYWMVPDITARQARKFIEFGKMDTRLAMHHGSQMSGIARGTTPTFAHLSELAEFEHFGDPADIVDSSLLRAMHDSPRTFLLLEGTAEGQHNWWHNKWNSAKEGFLTHTSRLRPVFLPWFVGTDLYPTETWLRAHPIKPNFQPQPWMMDHAARARDYVQSDPLLQKYLGSNWSMPVEQMWFYEVTRDEHIREGKLNKFLQEMPANDDEAFQSTSISVFDTETIVHYRDNCVSPLPPSGVGVFGLQGPPSLIHPRFQPHHTQIDTNKKPIELCWTWGSGIPIRFTLIPLKWTGYPTDSGLDKIYIWEEPEPGEIYGCGVDTSDGVQKDRTTVEVLRKGSPWKKAAQVAEFASSKLSALDATPFVMALADYYSVHPTDPVQFSTAQSPLSPSGGRRQSRVAIECRGNGDQTQNKMRMEGWSNFHPWMKIDSKNPNRSQYNKIGVFTNQWFRAGMMEYLIKMLRDNEIDIRSPFCVQEMQSLEGDEFVQSLKAAHGAHDDRIMGLGFVIISLYQWERSRQVAGPSPVKPPTSTTRSYARYQYSPQEIDLASKIRTRH